MTKFIKETAILNLCFGGFAWVLFQKLRVVTTWMAVWQVPSYHIDTTRLILLNLPWIGLAFYDFIMMRTNFENSFLLRVLRFETTCRICWQLNRQIMRQAFVVGLSYIVMMQLVAGITRKDWLCFEREAFVCGVMLVVLIFMLGLLQLMVSIFFEPRLGLLIQLCYMMVAILLGQALVLNDQTSIWIQGWLWPQWLTVARLMALHYSAVTVVISFILITLILESGLYIAVKQKDWLKK